MFQLTDDVRKRYDAFWETEACGRCCLFMSLRREPCEAPPQAPDDIAARWEDIEWRTRQQAWQVANTQYFAEGFPNAFVNFGPGCLSAMIGGSHRWAERTVWFENEAVITDWTSPPPPVLDHTGAMYRLTEEYTRSLLKSGESCVSVPDIGGTFDIIAALRGTQNLLMDLYDSPDEIHAYVKRLQPVWRDYYQRCGWWTLAVQGCMSSWMPIWSDRAYYPLQCDFSAMISPDMFAEFILPDLAYQTEFLARSIYHLDGPGELPHLKQLLALPRLNAIQWTPGEGHPDLGDACWHALYREIQAAGKGLVLLGVPPERLEGLLGGISQKGLFISCSPRDEQQARELIRIAECAK